VVDVDRPGRAACVRTHKLTERGKGVENLGQIPTFSTVSPVGREASSSELMLDSAR
jgi:hypothetical protein